MNLQKFVASVSAFTVALTNFVVPVTASAASSYSDASQVSSWATGYVDSLVSAGIFDGTGSFNPQRSLNRAELAKIATKAAGLAEDTKGAPHFNDVAPSDWFYTYVETLYNNNVVGGINGGALDANGKATFDPNGTVNRAQAAKILVEALDLQTAHAGNGATFSDVQKGAWYYDYVETAYAHGILSGYGDGRFGPDDAVTREQVAKIAQLSREEAGLVTGTPAGSHKVTGYTAGAASAVTTTTTPSTSTATPPSDGTLSVAVSTKSPAAQTVAKGATGIVVASYDLTASSAGDVVVSGIKVQRTGVGARGDIEALYLYDGDTKLTGSRTISADTNVAEFSNVSLTVAKGTTKTINVVADILYTAGGSDQHAFGLTATSSVTSNAKSVTGNFPVSGSTLTIGGSAVGYIQVQSTGSVSNPTVGDKAIELAKFQLTAGANNVRLNKVVLNQTGTVGSDKLANLKLFQGSTDLGATVTRANDRFTFVLPTAFAIANGTNKIFTVKGDLTGGLNSQTIIFNIEEKADIQATDEVMNTNAITFDSNDTTTTNSFSNTALQTLTVKGGDVNVAFTGPAAKNISKGVKDAKIWEGTLTVAANATVKNTYVYLTSTETSGATAGLCDNASTSNFSDIKVINTETGGTLAGPVEYTCSTDTISGGADTSLQLTLTDDWQVEAGKTYKLAITTDVRNADSNATNDITATFGTNGSSIWTSTDLKKNDASEYLTSIVPGTAIVGNKQSVLSSSLTVSVASTPTSTTLVKGGTKRDLLGINLQAGSNSDVKVTSLKIVGDAGTATSDVDGDVAETGGSNVRASNVIQTVYLYDGTTLLSTKSFDTSADTATFDNISLTVTAGTTKTLTVRGDVNSSLSTTTYFAADVKSVSGGSATTLSSNITSEDVDGNDVTETAGTRSTNITAASTATALMTLSETGGTLTIAQDADTPTSALVLMGTAKKEVYKAKVTASTEDFKVTKLSFIADSLTATSGDQDNNITKVYLEYPDSLTSATSTKTAEGVLSAGIVNFDVTSAPMLVKKDQDARVKIYVDIADSTSATSQEIVQFYLNLANFEAYGYGSNVQQTGEDVRLGSSAGSIGSVAAGTAFAFGNAGTDTLTVADATTTSVTVAGNQTYKIGDIIYAGTEEMIVTANATATPITVLRGANGTTAAAHAGDNVYRLGQVTIVATDATAAAVSTAITGLVASANISRGDLLVGTTHGGSATTNKATFVATSNQLSGVTANLPIVTAAASSSKITAVTNTTARLATDDFYRLSSYRPVAGNLFSVAKSTAIASLSASSPSNGRTAAAKDLILAATFTNGGTFTSTLATIGATSGLTFTATGSFLVSATGGVDTFTVTVYDNADLNTSNQVATITMTETGGATGVYAQSAISFTKTVDIGANSSKTLYFTAATNGTTFTTTSSDDLLTAGISAYSWSDGVSTFTAGDTGYGITLPLSGNTLRY